MTKLHVIVCNLKIKNAGRNFIEITFVRLMNLKNEGGDNRVECDWKFEHLNLEITNFNVKIEKSHEHNLSRTNGRIINQREKICFSDLLIRNEQWFYGLRTTLMTNELSINWRNFIGNKRQSTIVEPMLDQNTHESVLDKLTNFCFASFH